MLNGCVGLSMQYFKHCIWPLGPSNPGKPGVPGRPDIPGSPYKETSINVYDLHIVTVRADPPYTQNTQAA